MNAHAFGSATQLAVEIRDRRVGCLELLDFYLARTERYNPALNAIIAWQIDAVRHRARDAALAKGEVWGPLHGILTVKESFNVAGLPTTFGNPLWKDNIAASNAVVVERLLQAGAIVFGKTNVPIRVYASSSRPGRLGILSACTARARADGPGAARGRT
jgi:amidase